ncbi:MAG TPA: hypothetical protein VFN18_11010 [Solirubrobacterales bacterium]|nr:hypothetical protein [Solirubrobacterales bacterium]
MAAKVAADKGVAWAYPVEPEGDADDLSFDAADQPTVGEGLAVTDVYKLRLQAQNTERAEGDGVIFTLFDQEDRFVFGFLMGTEGLSGLLWSQTQKGRRGGQQG